MFCGAAAAKNAAEASEHWAAKKALSWIARLEHGQTQKVELQEASLYSLARAVVASAAQHQKQFKRHLNSSGESMSQPAGGFLHAQVCEAVCPEN